MRIGVIGTGKMGTGLARLWVRAGHAVCLGSRTPPKAVALARELGAGASGAGVGEAAAFGEAVCLAVPWEAVPATLTAIGPYLAGKLLLDPTNPLWPGDGPGLTLGFTTSAGEELQRLAPRARVVKAFNAVFARVVQAGPDFGGQPATIFYCGDDAGAKALAATLIADTGFEPVDAGPLRLARSLESLVVLLVQLGYVEGLGRQIAVKLLRR